MGAIQKVKDWALGKAVPKGTNTIGVGGAVIQPGGYLESPERDARVVGQRKYKTYSEIMVNSSIVAAGTRYFLNLVTKARWKLETKDDSDEAKRYAELTEEIMHDMHTPWHRAIRRAAMYRFYGFSVQEWTAKRRKDGVMGFADVDVRPQATIERWLADRTGRVNGCVQLDPLNGREIILPRNKLIYLVDDTLSDTPEGMGIFRHLVEPAYRLKHYIKLEGFGFENDLHGMPVAYVPFAALEQLVKNNDLTPAQRDALIKPVKDFIQSHLKSPNLGMVLDSEMYRALDEGQSVSAAPKWKMDVMRVGLGGSLDQAGKAIDRLNHEMARILGCEHLLMGGNDRGSYAMSKDKTANFYLVVDAAVQEITTAYDNDWLKVLWELNGWPDEHRPCFKPETLKFSDVEQIATALRDMATAGAILTPDDPAVNDVRDLLGVARVPEDWLDTQEALNEARAPKIEEKPEGEDEEKPKPSEEVKAAIRKMAEVISQAVKEGKL